MTDSQRRYGALVGAIVIVIAVGLTFASVPGHDFVRWDDGSFIYLNPLFHRISWENMMQAWSPENGSAVYEPIVYTVLAPIASLAKLNVANPSVNEAGALLNPHPFHTFSLLVHILNSLQVYVLLLLLFPRRHMACTVGALLFGLHPLQVESLRGRLAATGGLMLCLR